MMEGPGFLFYFSLVRRNAHVPIWFTPKSWKSTDDFFTVLNPRGVPLRDGGFIVFGGFGASAPVFAKEDSQVQFFLHPCFFRMEPPSGIGHSEKKKECTGILTVAYWEEDSGA